MIVSYSMGVSLLRRSRLRAHVSMFDQISGSVARIAFKTGVINHPREGEIVLNDAYRQMAAHYLAAELPGLVREPKDDSSVEGSVAHVATWIIAALRDRAFHSLADLKFAIAVQM